MRWDELFRDLEGQLAAAEAADLAAEVADRTRRESALLTLADRVGGAVGSRVSVHAVGGARVDGVLLDVGPDWLVMSDDGGRDVLVPLDAVLGVAGLAAWTGQPPGPVAARLGLGSALRALARDRVRVTVLLSDGSTVAGTVDRVGTDFLEVSDRGGGEEPAGRAGTGRSAAVRTLAISAVAVIRASA